MRMYEEFADWWHLLSAVEEYEEEAATYRQLLLDIGSGRARTLLELGSGGGNNAFYLKRDFAMTLTDLSAGMLEQSRRINPDCPHFAGDMRTLRLGQQFDRVFVHDAICYMTTFEDLHEALLTAFVHCRSGGAALLCPDYIRETFEPGTDCGGNDGPTRAMRYLEWVHAPREGENTYEVDYVLVLREGVGPTQVVQERHREGLFSQQEWLEALSAVGFVAEMRDNDGRPCFVGLRPAA